MFNRKHTDSQGTTLTYARMLPEFHLELTLQPLHGRAVRFVANAADLRRLADAFAAARDAAEKRLGGPAVLPCALTSIVSKMKGPPSKYYTFKEPKRGR